VGKHPVIRITELELLESVTDDDGESQWTSKETI